MSILDEITKEKQRLSEALARVDAQRDKLTNQLTELEATERVLARYSMGTQTRKTRSGRPRGRRHSQPLRRGKARIGALRSQTQLASDRARRA